MGHLSQRSFTAASLPGAATSTNDTDRGLISERTRCEQHGSLMERWRLSYALNESESHRKNPT